MKFTEIINECKYKYTNIQNIFTANPLGIMKQVRLFEIK